MTLIDKPTETLFELSCGPQEVTVRALVPEAFEPLLQFSGHVELKAHFPGRKVWKFPDNPFVKYEPKDEQWCRYFGIGKEVEEGAMTFNAPNARLARFDGQYATFNCQPIFEHGPVFEPASGRGE